MLVGMPFSGKTTALNTLQRALSEMAEDGSMHPGCVVHQATFMEHVMKSSS